MTNASLPSLHFRESLDEYFWWEISQKGWYTGTVAELPGGKYYALTFYDPSRLSQDLQGEVELGRPCLVEHALVVVPEVTKACMNAAVQMLFSRGWFEHLVPSKTVAEALHAVGAGL